MSSNNSNETKNADHGSDEYFMRRALHVAERALEIGEVPVGCIIVKTTDRGKVVVSHGANQVNATRDATRHAEMVAIDRMLTGGQSSDQLRLPTFVFVKSSRRAGASSNAASVMSSVERLQPYWDDIWVNNETDAEHWSNEYGWKGVNSAINKQYSAQDLAQCELFVTCEPCIMCAAALAQLRFHRVVFGCDNDKFGGCGSILSLHENMEYHVGYPIERGLLNDEAVALLRKFYQRENFHAPDDKRKRKDIREDSSTKARESTSNDGVT